MRRNARIDKNKKACESLSAVNILRYNASEFVSVGFASPCIAIAGKINYIPAVVNEEMVYEHGFSGARRGHCQFFSATQHVYEAAFAHVAPANESVFRLSVVGTQIYVGVAYDKFRFQNVVFVSSRHALLHVNGMFYKYRQS